MSREATSPEATIPWSDLNRVAAAPADLERLVDRYLGPASELPAPRDKTRIGPAVQAPPKATGLCTSTNQYLLREKIGQGGMGVVYRAFDEKLHRDVALKVLISDQDDALERFIREQEITACLDHPNFVRVLAMGYMNAGGRSLPFYTMPLIRGRTLEKLVIRRRFRDPEGLRLRREFTPAVLLRMVDQLCLALQSAHDKRIIHRDIKPSNILVGPYGEVYVTDLGLAKYLAPAAGESVCFDLHVMEQLTKASAQNITQETMMGTPYYMAPEQAVTPGSVDQRADVFGLGAVLYFILTGRKPEYVPAVVDREKLMARKRVVVAVLKNFVDPSRTAASILALDKRQVPEAARSFAEEYREILGLLSNMEFFKLRLTLKECRILPPNELPDRAAAVVSGFADASGRIAPALEAICMKALARDPQQRYSSCWDFWEALHDYVESAADPGAHGGSA